MKVGVLIVGAKGGVASTLIAANIVSKLKNIEFKSSTDNEEFKNLKFINHDNLIFGGWDFKQFSIYDTLISNRVIDPILLDEIKDNLNKIEIFESIVATPEKNDITYNDVDFIKSSKNQDIVEKLDKDITKFINDNKCDLTIMVNLSSTEKTVNLNNVHNNIKEFEKGLLEDSLDITTSMIYAYAAFKNGCHYINFTPSISSEIPALDELALKNGVVHTGKDGKTGQTMYKSILAPMFKYRNLKVDGWYSTNILGNRDGLTLSSPKNAETKITSKSKLLGSILGYDNCEHQVHIHYYKPKGDNKEAWDNIDFTGWFGVPMQMKVNWLGNDSILAAPLVFDLIRWTEFASRKNKKGLLKDLAVFYKTPLGTDKANFFEQYEMLMNLVN